MTKQPYSLGQMVKQLRRSKGLTQAAVADSVGKKPAWLSRVESDDIRPSGTICRHLAHALGAPEGRLLEASTRAHLDPVETEWFDERLALLSGVDSDSPAVEWVADLVSIHRKDHEGASNLGELIEWLAASLDHAAAGPRVSVMEFLAALDAINRLPYEAGLAALDAISALARATAVAHNTAKRAPRAGKAAVAMESE